MSIIAAITTPFGEGGVAIIRISGAGVFSVLKNNIGLINIEEKGKNTINFAHFLDDDGSKIDEILVSKFIKPNSYTGEDTLEINCHGGIYVTNKILKTILKNKGIKRFFIEDFLGSQDSPSKKSFSIALGIFIGLSPIWGFQTLLVIFLAIVFKLNKAIAFAFSNISLPPFIPFILYASSKMGQFILDVNYNYTLDTFKNNFEITDHLKTYIIGSFSLAILGATICGILGFLFFSIFDKKKTAVQNG